MECASVACNLAVCRSPLAMLPNFTPRQLLALHLAVVLLALVSYAAVSLARRQRRHPSAAIGWVMLLVLAPYVGLPLFLMFGSRKTKRARRQTRVAVQDRVGQALHGPGGRMRALALSMGLPGAVPCEALAIHPDGASALERLKTVLQSARHTLEVSTFLLGRDALGDEIVALLARR